MNLTFNNRDQCSRLTLFKSVNNPDNRFWSMNNKNSQRAIIPFAISQRNGLQRLILYFVGLIMKQEPMSINCGNGA